MNTLWILLIVGVLILVSRKTVGGEGNQTRDFTGYDELFRRRANAENIDWILIKAIAYQESRFNTRAYNTEGYAPPAGRPAFRGEIPAGADISGYQGSFGLGQLYHSIGWSTARAIRPGGNYPAELLDPSINVQIMAEFIGQLTAKGFGLDTIDVYNVGETEYHEGLRNPAYRVSVKAHYEYFVGMAT